MQEKPFEARKPTVEFAAASSSPYLDENDGWQRISEHQRVQVANYAQPRWIQNETKRVTESLTLVLFRGRRHPRDAAARGRTRDRKPRISASHLKVEANREALCGSHLGHTRDGLFGRGERIYP
jgi:hypothetical protein